MNTTQRRPTAVRWAILAGEILACVAGVSLVLLVALIAYVGHEVGDPWSPGPMSGKVGDAELRLDYDRSPLVTTTQVAAVHRQMPAKVAFHMLGARPNVFVPFSNIKGHWINGHWARTSISYDYPIAGTGHLYHGITVADEFEITISAHSNSVVKITRIPWRAVGRADEIEANKHL
jgi:hypothetical protein